jgi:hypothetical protein
LNKNFINTLREYINIVDILNVYQVDQDFDLLKDKLIQTKKEVYAPKDFYVIKHYDPQYYLPHCKYSLTTFNLVQTFQEIDISLGRVIIVTNNPGYLDEFKLLIPDKLHQCDLPIVFDDCISAFDNNHLDNPKWNNIAINNDKIEKHCLTMMARGRVHRNALYNHIKNNNYLDQIATANQGNNES